MKRDSDGPKPGGCPVSGYVNYRAVLISQCRRKYNIGGYKQPGVKQCAVS